MASGRLRLLTTDAQFSATVNFLVAPKINKILRKAKPLIQRKVSDLLRTVIEGSPAIRSLEDGVLRVDFGLEDGMADSATRDIVNAVVSSLVVEFQAPKSKRSLTLGSLSIRIDPGTVAALVQISTTAGIYNSNGHNISWLNWLMTKGTEVVVEEFDVVSTEYDERSRSGGGFMIKTGGAFRVAPEFAGTPGDNFITRAIIANQNNISNIIRTEFGKLL
jgi:hypothetical protein